MQNSDVVVVGEKRKRVCGHCGSHDGHNLKTCNADGAAEKRLLNKQQSDQRRLLKAVEKRRESVDIGLFQCLPLNTQLELFSSLDLFSLIKFGLAIPGFKLIISAWICRLQNGGCGSVSVDQFRAQGCLHGNQFDKLVKRVRDGKICLCCGCGIENLSKPGLKRKKKTKPNQFIEIRWPDITKTTTQKTIRVLGKGLTDVVKSTAKNVNWRSLRIHKECETIFSPVSSLMAYSSAHELMSYYTEDVPLPLCIFPHGAGNDCN